MRLKSVNKITVKYFEYPSDIEPIIENLSMPSSLDTDKETIKDFMECCLGIEVFSIDEIIITEVTPC